MDISIFRSKFFYLLLSLIIYAVSTSILAETGQHRFYLGGLFSLIVIICLYTIIHNKYLVFLTTLLGVLTLTCHWLVSLFEVDRYFHVLFYISNTFFLVIICFSVLHVVTKHSQITTDSLFGAVCGYFLLGFVWSNIYLLIDVININAFSKPLVTSSIHVSSQHGFYFSFTTMTTLGYGDIIPLSNVARTFAWLEAMLGQIYLAVWISLLVGLQIAQNRKL